MNIENGKRKNLYIINSGVEQCAPKHDSGPATRDHFLIHYILSGHGIYCVGEKTYHLKKGDGFIIYPNVSAYYQADAENPWEYCWIGFYGDQAETLMNECGLGHGPEMVFSYTKDNRAEQILREAAVRYGSSGGINQLELIGHLYLFLSCIAKSNDGKNNSLVDRVADYIHYNYSYSIKISEIASFIGLNRSYLCKIFTRELGISPQEYLLKFRLAKAKCLIKETKMNLSEIAFSCGFNDATYFSNIFKKREGISPRMFRKRYS